MDEIHRPVLAAAGGHRHRPAVQADPLAPTHSRANLESLQLVEPMHTFAADVPAIPYEQDVQALLAEARPSRRQFPQSLPQGASVARLRTAVQARVPETDQRARPADAELEAIPYPLSEVSSRERSQIFFLAISTAPAH
jgi:hypothetical protein